jgi:hypothetical protein
MKCLKGEKMSDKYLFENKMVAGKRIRRCQGANPTIVSYVQRQRCKNLQRNE